MPYNQGMEKPAFTEEQRAYFRAAAGRRQRGTRACAVCGQSFEGLAWQRFCSKRCADREMQRRARERRRQASAAPGAPAPAAD
jgi:endogenous inhibitor of DNA gyrase (YacG/DUF329 family)